jgi:hypothetical protein
VKEENEPRRKIKKNDKGKMIGDKLINHILLRRLPSRRFSGRVRGVN